ncbi:MAG: TonB-dependent receptor, partial [Phaeodactylibacter sp.]|nr:TonB-dependent receptor [Phaeodactylibacter sp.]
LIGVGDAGGLRQIPANLIDKVEVITNPSARYEAQGMTGIINIVLKKDQQTGLNGTFDFSVGYPENYGAAINLNYRRKKMNLFANYGVYYRTNPGSGGLYQETYRNDSTFILEESRTHNRGGLSNSFRFGSDFFFNPKNTLTASLSYRLSDEQNKYELEYRDYLFDLDNFLGSSLREDQEQEDEMDREYSVNYKKTFSSDKHYLTVDLQHEQNRQVESSEITENFYDTESNPTGAPALQQRSSNDEGFQRWLLRADYVHPIGKEKEGKFELGWQSGLRTVENSYLVEEFNDVEWVPLAAFSNDFNYEEEIHAGYGIIGNKTGNFSYQAGLRLEYTGIRTELLQTGEVNPRDYTNLFPSGHLTYEFKDQNSLQLSYSRRISRPRFRHLNPFFSYTNSRNFWSGNPNLDPEFSDVVEFQHLKYWEKASLSSSIYYRQTQGVIERVRLILDEEAGTTIGLPINLSTEDAYGLEFTYSYNPLKWFRLNGDFNFFRALRYGVYEEQVFEADTYTWFT